MCKIWNDVQAQGYLYIILAIAWCTIDYVHVRLDRAHDQSGVLTQIDKLQENKLKVTKTVRKHTQLLVILFHKSF